MQAILMIAGPTAVGKTSLAIKLAKQFNGEIINGDSMQVYRELSIGTAKPTQAEQDQVPHHLIDTHSFSEHYDMAQFGSEAIAVIQKLHERKKLPIIVGGSGLYLQSLVENYNFGGIPRDPLFYEQWKTTKRTEIFKLLGQTEDDNIPTRRLLRQLEIHFAQKRMKKDLNQGAFIHQTKGFMLTCQRSVLYERINQRVDWMLEQGLLQEAKMLYDWHNKHRSSSNEGPTALKAIGYKELFPYFAGNQSLDACIKDLKQATRRYAKRQLTWFRNRMPYLERVDLITKTEGMNAEDLLKIVDRFLQSQNERS